MDEQLECIQSFYTNPPCDGSVHYRMPLSETGKSFPYCDRHWTIRLVEHERLRSDYPDSPIAPAWFDPLAAGERWDDDY